MKPGLVRVTGKPVDENDAAGLLMNDGSILFAYDTSLYLRVVAFKHHA